MECGTCHSDVASDFLFALTFSLTSVHFGYVTVEDTLCVHIIFITPRDKQENGCLPF